MSARSPTSSPEPVVTPSLKLLLSPGLAWSFHLLPATSEEHKRYVLDGWCEDLATPSDSCPLASRVVLAAHPLPSTALNLLLSS
mmetsp:Transcript_19641/g.59523  ORF Transcript_19641/g.59523 Transcript_19641/m.59523 type:complete len:84 (+) Transcript_19641:2321-2572(+)